LLCDLFDTERIHGMDYRIEAWELLLDRDCILERYDPLIPYRETLTENLLGLSCRTKEECCKLPDETLICAGLPRELVGLFRRFLTMYDVPKQKFKEIECFAANEAEAAALRELYQLPGVKQVRARLYYDAGYTTLRSIAVAQTEQLISDTAAVIAEKGLTLKAPLPKEVRTQLAVARVLCDYGVTGEMAD